MSYQFRVPADDGYLSALGRAIYNFAYLEWCIVYLADKLQPGYVNSVDGKTAGTISSDFQRLASRSTIVNPAITSRLQNVASAFSALVERRNHLVHGNPVTAASGAQRLHYSNRGTTTEWSETDIITAAIDFEAAAIEANDLFHNHFP